jgi:hypothetical protein
METCIFCNIVNGEAPCHKIWEDAKHLAFLSIFPNTQGFSVVITGSKQERLWALKTANSLTLLTLTQGTCLDGGSGGEDGSFVCLRVLYLHGYPLYRIRTIGEVLCCDPGATTVV